MSKIRLNKLKCYELINCTNTNAPLPTPVWSEAEICGTEIRSLD